MSNPGYELARLALGLLLTYESDTLSSMRERCVEGEYIIAFSEECQQRRAYIVKQCERMGIKPPTDRAARALVDA